MIGSTRVQLNLYSLSISGRCLVKSKGKKCKNGHFFIHLYKKVCFYLPYDEFIATSNLHLQKKTIKTTLPLMKLKWVNLHIYRVVKAKANFNGR